MVRLEEQFKQIEGILNPIPFGSAGNGKNITVRYEGEKTILDFP